MRYLLLIAASAAAVPIACQTASAQDAPPTFEACTSNVNGIPGVISPRSCASVSASGQAPYGQYAQNYTAIGNGRQATNATDGSATTSSSAGGWNNTATATSNTGGIATASGNLTDGTLHAFVSNGSNFFHGGYANTRISDLLTFNNTSGSAIALDFGYSFDGRFTGTFDNYTDGSVALRIGLPDTAYGPVLFAGSGNHADGTAVSRFDAVAGSLDQNFYFASPTDYAFTGGYDGATGMVQGSFSTTLLIPTGVSDFGFAMTLSLDCRGTGATCDFGHTGKLGLGALPSGLSFTSASGVLFSSLAETPVAGPAPEPATWALMIAGFGMAGTSLRSRRRVAPAMA